MKNFPIPIIVSSDFKEPRTVSGRGPLATGLILLFFLSSSTSVFIDLRKHFVCCV